MLLVFVLLSVSIFGVSHTIFVVFLIITLLIHKLSQMSFIFGLLVLQLIRTLWKTLLVLVLPCSSQVAHVAVFFAEAVSIIQTTLYVISLRYLHIRTPIRLICKLPKTLLVLILLAASLFRVNHTTSAVLLNFITYHYLLDRYPIADCVEICATRCSPFMSLVPDVLRT